MKYLVKVSATVVKQLTVEGLTEEQIWEDRDIDPFEHAIDEVEIERTNDFEVLEVNPYVPLPGESE